MMVATQPVQRQDRGKRRREAIIEAAAELITHDGLAAFSHRSVAAKADVPLAATTYYFADLDELLAVTGEHLVAVWTDAARAVFDAAAQRNAEGAMLAAAQIAEVVTQAVLPPGDTDTIRGHYEQLVLTGTRPALARGVSRMRPNLDAALTDFLHANDVDAGFSAAIAIALVDGATISALSEGHDPRQHATAVMTRVLEQFVFR